MINPTHAESAPRRAWRDSEQFRQSPWFFWGAEVLGAAVLGAGGTMLGTFLVPTTPSTPEQVLYPLAGGAIGIVLGLTLVFFSIFLWHLWRAPLIQRDEARSALLAEQRRLAEALKPPSIEWRTSVDQGIDYHYASVLVTNQGPSSVANCHVQLDTVSLGSGELVKGFSPLILKWDGHKGIEREVGISLQVGQTARVTVCASPQDHPPGTLIKIKALRTRGVRFIPATDAIPVAKINYPPGTYHIMLRLLGDNIKDVTSRFVVSVDKDPKSLTIQPLPAPK